MLTRIQNNMYRYQNKCVHYKVGLITFRLLYYPGIPYSIQTLKRGDPHIYISLFHLHQLPRCLKKIGKHYF